MNQLTVRQRKMVYAGTAVALFIAVIALGRPATGQIQPDQPSNGGLLAQSRHVNELGEASLGNVDPTSATMNLVLLGLRGVAASVLWQQADYYKDRKNFQQLEETVESIILLQPHFKTVWEYQAWNLAFNVSNECDAVADRYFWVKRGAKFLIRGTQRNKKVPELSFETGRFFGQKIGRADEKEVFRRYFVRDPDEERWKEGPDEEINPEGKDNFLVAKDWYLVANKTLEFKGVEQHKMDLALFLAYPYRSQIDYARAKQRDGVQQDMGRMSPDEREQAFLTWSEGTRGAYDDAYNEWVDIYGHMEMESSGGGTLVLETDDAAMATLDRLADKEGMPREQKRDWQDRYRKLTSYPYSKMHCDIERRETMTRARFELAEGRRLFREVQDFEEARKFLESGMRNLAEVIKLYDTAEGGNLLVTDEVEIVEDGIKGLLFWQQVLTLLGEPIPEDYPLKSLWTNPELKPLIDDLQRRFLLWQGST